MADLWDCLSSTLWHFDRRRDGGVDKAPHPRLVLAVLLQATVRRRCEFASGSFFAQG